MKFDNFMQILFTSMLGFCVWFLGDLNTNVNELRKEVAKSNTWIEIFREGFNRQDAQIGGILHRLDILENRVAKRK